MRALIIYAGGNLLKTNRSFELKPEENKMFNTPELQKILKDGLEEISGKFPISLVGLSNEEPHFETPSSNFSRQGIILNEVDEYFKAIVDPKHSSMGQEFAMQRLQELVSTSLVSLLRIHREKVLHSYGNEAKLEISLVFPEKK